MLYCHYQSLATNPKHQITPLIQLPDSRCISHLFLLALNVLILAASALLVSLLHGAFTAVIVIVVVASQDWKWLVVLRCRVYCRISDKSVWS